MLTLAALTAALAAYSAVVEFADHSACCHDIFSGGLLAMLLVGHVAWLYVTARSSGEVVAAAAWPRAARHALPAAMIGLAVVVGLSCDVASVGASSERSSPVPNLLAFGAAVHLLVCLLIVAFQAHDLRRQSQGRHGSRLWRRLQSLEIGAATVALLTTGWLASWALPEAASGAISHALLAIDMVALAAFGQRMAVASAWPARGGTVVAFEMEKSPYASNGTGTSSACNVGGTAEAVDGAGREVLTQPSGATGKTKYAKSAVAPEQARDIAKRLAQHVADDKPFLDCDLTLADLAAAVNATPHQLSQVLSTTLGMNFFEYVNGLRAEAVKATLERPQSRDRPLLEIALECGFGSKTAFNHAFKRATGLSPSEYRKSLCPPSMAGMPSDRNGHSPSIIVRQAGQG